MMMKKRRKTRKRKRKWMQGTPQQGETPEGGRVEMTQVETAATVLVPPAAMKQSREAQRSKRRPAMRKQGGRTQHDPRRGYWAAPWWPTMRTPVAVMQTGVSAGTAAAGTAAAAAVAAVAVAAPAAKREQLGLFASPAWPLSCEDTICWAAACSLCSRGDPRQTPCTKQAKSKRFSKRV